MLRIKENVDKCNYVEMNSSGELKLKLQGEGRWLPYRTDKGLKSRIHKESVQINRKKTDNLSPHPQQKIKQALHTKK